MQQKTPEERLEYYTWNNSVQRLCYSIAGSRRAYERLNRSDRLDVRSAAKHLHELGRDIPTAEIAEKTERKGFVYVIGHPAWPEHLKIGRAFDPESRLKGFQTGCPRRAYVLLYARYFDDCYVAERALHYHFDKYRREGEWFYIDEHEAIEAIDRQKEYEQCGPR